MKLTSDPKVKEVFKRKPEFVQKQLQYLRTLVVSTAHEIEDLDMLEETLKWGEPSYLTKHGSTVRIDWKEKTPNQYAIYFKCTSRLVETFKELHKDTFNYEGNRAIVFQLEDKVPEAELKQCIAMALTYHKIKHLPLLGAE